MRPHRIRSLLVCSTSLLLMACGGGDAGLSTRQVTEVAQALSATGSSLASQSETLDLQTLELQYPRLQLVPPDLIPGPQYPVPITGSREQPHAIDLTQPFQPIHIDLSNFWDGRELVCTHFLDEGCTGTLSIDVSFQDVDIAPWWAPAGGYITRTANHLQGMLGARQISMNGVTRTDFLTDTYFDQRLGNVRLQITNTNFSYSIDGVSFGPYTGVALLELDEFGALTYTVDQVSYSGMSNIVVTDHDNFSVGTFKVRRPHSSSANTFVVYDYQNWSVVAGRPAVGSTATFSTEGVAGNSVFTVATSSPTQVTYTVRSTVDGLVKNYLVTVDYPPDAAPVWSTVEVTG